MGIQIGDIFNLNYWRDFFINQISTSELIVNIVDVIVVWFLIYKLIMLVKGTKAIQLLKGIAIIILIRAISGFVGMNTVSYLTDQVITYGVLIIIIIFQPEVRRGLEHIGRGAIFRRNSLEKKREPDIILAYDKAIQYMSKRKIGALITIERETSLEEFVKTGIPLDADITGELLINIFIPNTPLHDGAVIVKGDKILVSCAYLPLSESETLSKEFGTRHRAALGISEVSDALTIIVSEETGDVSLTFDNRLFPHLSQEEYLRILNEQLVPKDTDEKEPFYQYFIDGFSKGASKK